ncbi:sirohydrochlorin chelatase [Clavibacter tessellarius]|uniref:sirohydrochlorin chelatase n=1 Tax=Clavibacter tessellarius TaxID=31965 RepID=UPI0032491B54
MWRSRVRDGAVEVARSAALVAASHGTSDPAGRRAVAGLVQAVRERRPDLRVEDAHVDVQQPDVPAAMEGLADADRAVVVVPLLLSAGYHVHVDLAEAAAEAAPREVRVAGALGPDPRLATVLARRLRAAGLADGDRVVLAAAGSSDAGAVADCHAVGAMLAAETRPRRGRVVHLRRPAARARGGDGRAGGAPGSRVVVATYLLAPGYFAMLAERAGGDATSAPLLVDGEAPPEETRRHRRRAARGGRRRAALTGGRSQRDRRPPHPVPPRSARGTPSRPRDPTRHAPPTTRRTP